MPEVTQSTFVPIITDPEEGGDYVSITQYIEKRYEQDLKKDASAAKLYFASLKRVIDRQEIQVLQQGKHLFIDWNKYKNYVFKRFQQKR